MTIRDRLKATEGRLDALFDVLVPGSSAGIRRLRAGAAAVCRDVGARGALLVGPAGSGKSTLARAVAFGRYVHLVTEAKAKEAADNVAIEPVSRVSDRFMDWYAEMSLTGLVTELADSQLFGIAKGVATGVDPRAGLFEKAATGRGAAEPSFGARLTGGVVFLDEIGDLSPALQPKLLTVLTGGAVTRVGAEASNSPSFGFRGLILAATWKDVKEYLRPDLLARLSDHVLIIPPLEERVEDIHELCDALISEVVRERREWLDEREKLKGEGFHRERARDALGRLEVFKLSGPERDLIRTVPWGQYGDLRGLSQVLRRSMTRAIPIHESLQQQQEVRGSSGTRRSVAEALLQLVLASPPEGRALAGAVSAAEREVRVELAEFLRGDANALGRLADHLNIGASELRTRLHDLTRDRTTR